MFYFCIYLCQLLSNTKQNAVRQHNSYNYIICYDISFLLAVGLCHFVIKKFVYFFHPHSFAAIFYSLHQLSPELCFHLEYTLLLAFFSYALFKAVFFQRLSAHGLRH